MCGYGLPVSAAQGTTGGSTMPREVFSRHRLHFTATDAARSAILCRAYPRPDTLGIPGYACSLLPSRCISRRLSTPAGSCKRMSRGGSLRYGRKLCYSFLHRLKRGEREPLLSTPATLESLPTGSYRSRPANDLELAFWYHCSRE